MLAGAACNAPGVHFVTATTELHQPADPSASIPKIVCLTKHYIESLSVMQPARTMLEHICSSLGVVCRQLNWIAPSTSWEIARRSYNGVHEHRACLPQAWRGCFYSCSLLILSFNSLPSSSDININIRSSHVGSSINQHYPAYQLTHYQHISSH